MDERHGYDSCIMPIVAQLHKIVFLPHCAVTLCALFLTKYSKIMQRIHVTLIPQPDACTTFELDSLPLQIHSFLHHQR